MTEKTLLVIHLLSAGVFLGTNVLAEFVFHRVKMLPPSEAMTHGDGVGWDMTVINGTALVAAGASGIALIYVSDLTSRFGDGAFWGTGYGIGLALMMGLWLTVVISATLIIYMRYAGGSALPFSARQEDVIKKANTAVDAAAWMQRLGWYNLGAAIILFVVGGFLRYGGF